MTVTIHQPEHLPWQGLIQKIDRADLFVVLDTVQFVKNHFHNRNRIGPERAPKWVTVPVKNHPLDTPIRDIQIAPIKGWRDKYLTTVRTAYKGAPYFPEVDWILHGHICDDFDKLIDLNMRLLNWLLAEYGVSTPIVMASDLQIDPALKASDRILAIVQATGHSTYLSGPGGANYLDLESFERAGIEVEWHRPVGAHLSAIDRLFLEGPP